MIGLEVQSFSSTEMWYEIILTGSFTDDNNNIKISTCDCPAFIDSELICKHMFLASHITGLPLFNAPPALSVTTRQQSNPVCTASTEQILIKKSAARSRIVSELDAICGIWTQFESLDLQSVPRSDLVTLESHFVSWHRFFSDIVHSRALHAH